MDFIPPYYPYMRIHDNAHRMHIALIFGHVRNFTTMQQAKPTILKMSEAAALAGYMWAIDNDSIIFHHRRADHVVGEILFDPELCSSTSLSSSE
jgi:hypothetical protein